MSSRRGMGFVIEAMQLMKMNSFEAAAKMLEAHLNDTGLKPSAKVGLMSWISECYLKGEDRVQAAKWAELAGKAALSCKDIPSEERTRRAREEFERALGYYEAVNDITGMGRLASLKYGLNPS
jgi:hypothetical protein